MKGLGFQDSFGSSFGGDRRRHGDSGEAKLNITSMMDMFTIMLIFLLLNFAPDTADLKIDKELALPTSTSERPYEAAVKVALTRRELLVGDDVVARVKKGHLQAQVVDGDIIVPLQKALIMQREKVESSDEAIVIFYADKDVEFTLVDQVMRTAATAGFPNFKFAVAGAS